MCQHFSKNSYLFALHFKQNSIKNEVLLLSGLFKVILKLKLIFNIVITLLLWDVTKISENSDKRTDLVALLEGCGSAECERKILNELKQLNSN